MRCAFVTVIAAGLIACGEGRPQDPDLAAWKGVETGVVIEQAEPPIAGKVVFHRRGCQQCHTTDGSRWIGPSLNEVYGTERPLTDGTTVFADEAYLRESILHARERIIKGYRGEMPMYERVISRPEVDVLVAYIKSLRPDAGPDDAQP